MNTEKTIVIDDAVPYAKEIFSHLGHIITLPGRDIDNQTLKEADALIVRSRTQVNEALLQGTKVKFVGSTVVGLDHVDQTYLKDRGIYFYSAQGCNANSVAEFVITAIFNLAEERKIDLSTKTLGIIGVGNVGSRLHDKAQKLGIKCLLNDPPKLEAHPKLTDDPQYVSLNECLKADIISVHTPLTKDGKYPTHNLISAKHLANITSEQILINAARGGIINEEAWLNTKTLANIIDCWENEPYINEALYKTAWIATPHIAGHSLDAKVAGSSMVYKELCEFWQTTTLQDWQSSLPKPPEAINIKDLEKEQSTLADIFTQTHNPLNDDLAIRDEKIENIHKKYEFYRRNFPIYREWHCHSAIKSTHKKINNLLISLGFSVK